MLRQTHKNASAEALVSNNIRIMNMRHLPNLITGMRFLLVPPLVWLLLQQRYLEALGLFAVMGVSDGLDGFLAKRYNWGSVLGAYMDPLADKLMLICTYITLAWQSLLPVWLVVVIILRDMVILSGAVAYHFKTQKLEMAPSIASKVNTFFQIVLIVAVIFQQIIIIPVWLVWALIIMTLLTTFFSGIGYVVEWSRRAHEAKSQ